VPPPGSGGQRRLYSLTAVSTSLFWREVRRGWNPRPNPPNPGNAGPCTHHRPETPSAPGPASLPGDRETGSDLQGSGG
jgi:hypothetical protein